MITAFGDVQSAVGALKAGAFDFVSKPVDLGTLRQLVQQALSLREQQTDTGELLVGESAGLRSLREQIERLARSQAPVLITGEAGVGKCLVAKQIHRQGPRARRIRTRRIHPRLRRAVRLQRRDLRGALEPPRLRVLLLGYG